MHVHGGDCTARAPLVLNAGDVIVEPAPLDRGVWLLLPAFPPPARPPLPPLPVLALPLADCDLFMVDDAAAAAAGGDTTPTLPRFPLPDAEPLALVTNRVVPAPLAVTLARVCRPPTGLFEVPDTVDSDAVDVVPAELVRCGATTVVTGVLALALSRRAGDFMPGLDAAWMDCGSDSWTCATCAGAWLLPWECTTAGVAVVATTATLPGTAAAAACDGAAADDAAPEDDAAAAAAAAAAAVAPVDCAVAKPRCDVSRFLASFSMALLSLAMTASAIGSISACVSSTPPPVEKRRGATTTPAAASSAGAATAGAVGAAPLPPAATAAALPGTAAAVGAAADAEEAAAVAVAVAACSRARVTNAAAAAVAISSTSTASGTSRSLSWNSRPSSE